MKLEFTMAAEVALVARPSQPISGGSPALSSAVTPSTPMRESGSCAPTRAQAMPSSTRCLARSRTEAGTSSSVVCATQVASRPVGPAGAVAGRPVAVTAVGVLEVILDSPHPWRPGGGITVARCGLALVVAYYPDCQGCTSSNLPRRRPSLVSGRDRSGSTRSARQPDPQGRANRPQGDWATWGSVVVLGPADWPI